MHWVLQGNLHAENGYEELIRVLTRAGIPFSQHKVIPFIGQLEPDISPEGKVIVIGSYSMRHVAKAKNWNPGSFDIGDDFAMQKEVWGDYLLNNDATVSLFSHARPNIPDFFIRPVADSKDFAGTIMSKEEFEDWQQKVVKLGEDDGSGLNANTEVFWCRPKVIQREYRLWVVKDEVVTASLYKIGNTVRYDSNVEQEVLDFGKNMAALYPAPVDAYVLDVCLTPDGWRIVETNTLNASGFYAANIGKLVDALESNFG